MDITEYKRVQSIAKNVHDELMHLIAADSTEESIAKDAITLLNKHGIDDTWYHGVPAFVLLGSRSCLSISGRDYIPSTEKVGMTNLVTIDLSPSLNGVWGDCARSFVVENGCCTQNPQTNEFIDGKRIQAQLHERMMKYVTPETRLSELFEFGNQTIAEFSYENLDFLGNLGHSIETTSSARRYIDKESQETLGCLRLFTFEPHIRKPNGKWGFKHENIYYFDPSGVLQEL